LVGAGVVDVSGLACFHALSLSTPSKKCPVCGKPATKEHEPFCSKRCAEVDLNRWLSGTYVIPGKRRDEGEDDPGD
jgi:endogenous inhibitor of DNA gyrase (YacG/DUF329 family)